MERIQQFVHPHGLKYLEISTELCDAIIFFQGAQISHFKPKNQAPLLWLSSEETYSLGTSLRGGIPICWPWFGQEAMPQHGFARNLIWELTHQETIDGAVHLTFSLPIDNVDAQLWPYKFKLLVHFVLGQTLEVRLETHNLTQQHFSISQALHTYFAIDNIDAVHVTGLEHLDYIEFELKKKGNKTPITIHQETDRIYLNAPCQQWIHTPQGTIEVTRQGSQSVVLWNPWIKKSHLLSNFGDHDYQKMLCLEACNIMSDRILLKPESQCMLSQTIGWK
jgi:glucose-6-phosphate 1-epimerase